jgi:hypothetical protein
MLEIVVKLKEEYDEDTERFIVSDSFKVYLEHSLVSMSKWESVWEQPFLGKEEKTTDQTLSYVKMMILNDDLPPEILEKVLNNHLREIQAYILAPNTATRLPKRQNAIRSMETITSELIYYWMISLNVPVQFENWHINRLITLIEIINIKNSPKKKMSVAERRALNNQRRAKYNTRG